MDSSAGKELKLIADNDIIIVPWMKNPEKTFRKLKAMKLLVAKASPPVSTIEGIKKVLKDTAMPLVSPIQFEKLDPKIPEITKKPPDSPMS
mmetsp:Transcript_25727/g.45152  ORF Transcript_25727/g.45152 Transcript_25727/m.45152 type:complete len:91 (-) Transcript_25727:2650-2922(-)